MKTSLITKLAALAAGALVLAACGGGAAAPTAAPAKPAGGSGQAVTLEIGSKGDELLFDKTTFEVPAGSKVTLKLKNNATTAATMHNWVLTKAGQADAVATDGITAGESKGYLKADDARVIAHTKMIKGGESDSVTFDAPAPGSYPFVCTFPGHSALMKGTLVVK